MFDKAPEWMTLLGKSETGDRDYAPTVEGKIPEGLRGSLYRNGPGLFERGGDSIQHLLDGDGLIQRLSFTDNGVRYQNQFVQTEKFLAEQTANKRLYATWSSKRFNDSGDKTVTSSQASITVYPVHGKVIARDELGPSYEIHPETLATVGQVAAGQDIDTVMFKAHSKIDPETGEWILAGVQYGNSMKLHVATYSFFCCV